jgi:hypothetical protein
VVAIALPRILIEVVAAIEVVAPPVTASKPCSPPSASVLIIAQLALVAEFDASGLREPPKWLDKASTVRKTMSGERQNALQSAL